MIGCRCFMTNFPRPAPCVTGFFFCSDYAGSRGQGGGSATATGSPFRTLDQEIFEKERTLAAMQGATAGQARYFAVSSGTARGFNPHNRR
jgi:hypothetical protein